MSQKKLLFMVIWNLKEELLQISLTKDKRIRDLLNLFENLKFE